jgi:hypothetical protein
MGFPIITMVEGESMTKRLKANEAFRDKRANQKQTEKFPGDTKCPECGLIFTGGVWRKTAAAAARTTPPKLCPACLQIRGGRVGGMVEIGGSFTSGHREELLNRIRNVERQTCEDRPMERIISIKETKDRIVVSVTTEHLVARIAKAVQRDFGGDLQLKYAPEEKFAMAHWRRDV